MQPLPLPQAVLFDLDDTLTFRRASLRRFARRFLQEYAVHLQSLGFNELVRVMESVDDHGYRPRAEFVTLLCRELRWAQPPDERALLDYWQATFPLCCAPRPETAQALAWLRARGIALGLVTNGAEAIQQAKVDALGIRSSFAAIVISESAGVEKPDPRIFHLALSSLGVAPEQAWYVGDHPHNDVWGAAHIGMTSIWLPGPLGWPAHATMPDVQIADLSDLITLVRQAERSR